jgi:hypothetical protein
MPTATKDHRSKKNSSANEQFNRRRAALNQGNETHNQFQRIFRINCLKQRKAEGRLTEKNQKEIASLGITV